MNLLDGVNDVLKNVQVVRSDNELTSLSDTGKQIFIDNAIAAWNEAVDQIFSKSKVMRPNQACQDSIIIKTNKREYCLPDDMVQLRWPLHDETNGRYINEYPGGYEELRNALVQPDNYTGQPVTGAINPENGDLYVDRLPTASEDGNEYVFFYWKDQGLSKKSDIFPFGDTVYRALVTVVAELWRYRQNQRTNSGVIKTGYGRAVRALEQQPRDDVYIKRHRRYNTTPLGYDPYDSVSGNRR